MARRGNRHLSVARAGFAGDFRGWFLPLTIVIWSSKTRTSSWPGLRPGARRNQSGRADVSARFFGD
jgi:hypothetical protein